MKSIDEVMYENFALLYEAADDVMLTPEERIIVWRNMKRELKQYYFPKNTDNEDVISYVRQYAERTYGTRWFMTHYDFSLENQY